MNKKVFMQIRWKFLFCVLLFICEYLFLLPKVNSISAKKKEERCSPPVFGLVAMGDFCKTKEFDCSNPLNLPETECESYSFCHEAFYVPESQIYLDYCYQKKASPSITPIPTGCGNLGRNCCGGGREKWTCNEGAGNPVEEKGFCTCKQLAPPFSGDFCNGDAKCLACANGTKEYEGQGAGVLTALGCIPLGNTNNFIGWLLGKAVPVIAGIAFLFMVFGAFQILTSAGNPEKVKAGQELITAALSGLILIILSVFLLKLIGVDILQIPGFGN